MELVEWTTGDSGEDAQWCIELQNLPNFLRPIAKFIAEFNLRWFRDLFSVQFAQFTSR